MKASAAKNSVPPGARMTQIAAQFSGRCRRCKTPHNPGDGIWVTDATPGAICESCVHRSPQSAAHLAMDWKTTAVSCASSCCACGTHIRRGDVAVVGPRGATSCTTCAGFDSHKFCLMCNEVIAEQRDPFGAPDVLESGNAQDQVKGDTQRRHLRRLHQVAIDALERRDDAVAHNVVVGLARRLFLKHGRAVLSAIEEP